MLMMMLRYLITHVQSQPDILLFTSLSDKVLIRLGTWWRSPGSGASPGVAVLCGLHPATRQNISIFKWEVLALFPGSCELSLNAL